MSDLNFASHFQCSSCFPHTCAQIGPVLKFPKYYLCRFLLARVKPHFWQNVTQGWIWKLSTNSTRVYLPIFFRVFLSVCTWSCKIRLFSRNLSFSAFLQLEHGHVFRWELTRKKTAILSKFNLLKLNFSEKSSRSQGFPKLLQFEKKPHICPNATPKRI